MIRYVMVPTAAAVPSEDVVRGMAAAAEEEREAAAAAATGRQVERRKWREDQAELLDQLLPPATAGTGCVPPYTCPCSSLSSGSGPSSMYTCCVAACWSWRKPLDAARMRRAAA